MKKIFTLILLTCLLTILTSCNIKIVKVHPAHDINIKLVNSLGEEWILTPDMKGKEGMDISTIRMKLEYSYTGEEIKFWVDSFQFIGCDEIKGDIWLNPNGTYSFEYDSIHHKMDGTIKDEEKSHNGGITISEKGIYYININNDRRSLNHWNYISIYIVVNII